MARTLGVQVSMVGSSPWPYTEGQLSVLVNVLSIFIDIVPLFVLLVWRDWKEVKKFFTATGFAIGALMNLILMVHVLFVRGDEHREVLFVATVGFCLGTTYTFFLLGHWVVTNERADIARYLMILVLVCFVLACFGVFCGIFSKYKTEGNFLNWLLWIVVGVLNAVSLYPIITCKPFPDEEVTFYTWFMCVFNTIDATFFVSYAWSLGSVEEPLSVVSLINATCGAIQLIALAVVALLKGFRQVGAYLRSCGESCCGLFRVIAILFEVLGRHERTD